MVAEDILCEQWPHIINPQKMMLCHRLYVFQLLLPRERSDHTPPARRLGSSCPGVLDLSSTAVRQILCAGTNNGQRDLLDVM